jgi:hypothetical protein
VNRSDVINHRIGELSLASFHGVAGEAQMLGYAHIREAFSHQDHHP